MLRAGAIVSFWVNDDLLFEKEIAVEPGTALRIGFGMLARMRTAPEPAVVHSDEDPGEVSDDG